MGISRLGRFGRLLVGVFGLLTAVGGAAGVGPRRQGRTGGTVTIQGVRGWLWVIAERGEGGASEQSGQADNE